MAQNFSPARNQLLKSTILGVLVTALCSSVSFAAQVPASDYTGKLVLVDKNCVDGKYMAGPREKFYATAAFASIEDLKSTFSASDYMPFVRAVLNRRYPTGARVFDVADEKKHSYSFWFIHVSTAQDALSKMGTAIHETGHGITESSPQNWYLVSLDTAGKDVAFTAPGMHSRLSTSSSPMFSMERSRILGDDLNALRPPAANSAILMSTTFVPGDYGSDGMFAQTYLTGDPANTTFESGDQGFNSLIDEFNQYVGSMASAYYYNSRQGFSSERHGLLTWQWWLERYLRKIRREQPDQYQYVLGNTAWRELILTLWGRAWLYLGTDYAGQQPDTRYLTDLVRMPVALSEIQRIRDACGCTNPVELEGTPGATAVRSSPSLSTSRVGIAATQTKGGSVYFKLTGSVSPLVAIEIFGADGKMIRRVLSHPASSDNVVATWNCTNETGRREGTGIYMYRTVPAFGGFSGSLILQ